LYKIQKGQMENLIPGVVDYLKESRQPIGLQIFQGRYLFFEVLDPMLVYPNVEFSQEFIPSQTLTIQEAIKIVGDFETALEPLSPQDFGRWVDAFNQHHDSIQVWRSTGGCFSGIGYCLDTDYPVFEDHISATIAPVTLTNMNADPLNYFQFTGTGATYSVTGPDGSTMVPVLPTPLMPAVSAHKAASYIADNEQNFFFKQDDQWYGERRFQDLWLDKLKEIEEIKREATIIDTGAYPIGEVVEEEYTFGPFLDLSWFGESNRAMGEYDIDANWTGVFMHRSIVRTFEITIVVKTETIEAP
jgi:hypothetical protein